MKGKILVTGASGFLGNKLFERLSKHYNIVGIDRSAKNGIVGLDILDMINLKKILDINKPKIIIHCAAMTDVNLCEKEKNKTFELNVSATKNLVEFCKKNNSKLIFISTDAVFDGKKGDYKEEDKQGPMNVYGKTKAEAEKIVKQLKSYLIIRTSVLYGYGGTKFINKMVYALNNNKIVEVADDIRRSPTLIDDIAEAIKLVIEDDITGVLHVAGDTQDSLFGITKKIANVLGKDTNIVKPCSVTRYSKNIAPQPRDTTLNIQKAKSLGINLRSIEEGILFLKKKGLN